MAQKSKRGRKPGQKNGMSKNAKAVREAIEQRRLEEERRLQEQAEEEKQLMEDEELDHYSSDYGDEEGPQLDEQAESDAEENAESEFEDDTSKGVSNPLFLMTSGIGQQISTGP